MSEKSLSVIERNEVIRLTQLPIIEDKLDEVLASVKERLDALSGIVATEENYKEVKKVRADLKKELDELETLRKQIKKALEEPYKQFEQGAYKRISDAYNRAIGQIDSTVKQVEGDLISQRKEELRQYFDEYRQSIGVDEKLADARRSGIKVGLSGSMKSLKQQAKDFLDKLDGDLKAIDTMEDRDEVLVAYRDSLDVALAVKTVNDHKRMVEEEKKRREEMDAARLERIEQEAFIDSVISESSQIDAEIASWQDDVVHAPVEEKLVEGQETGKEDKSEEVVYSTSFCVRGTLDQLRALKAFLVDNNYYFETLKGNE